MFEPKTYGQEFLTQGTEAKVPPTSIPETGFPERGLQLPRLTAQQELDQVFDKISAGPKTAQEVEQLFSRKKELEKLIAIQNPNLREFYPRPPIQQGGGVASSLKDDAEHLFPAATNVESKVGVIPHEVVAAENAQGSGAYSIGDRIIRRGQQFSSNMIDSMINRGGRIGSLGQYVRDNGTQIATKAGIAFRVAGAAAQGAAVVFNGVQLHKMHQYRQQLRDLAQQHPHDEQMQEFFKINDEATKRNDVYFGVNTAISAAGIASTAAGVGIATGVLEGGGIAAGLASGPVGWALLGLGALTAVFTSIYEKKKQKEAYRNYLSKVYGNADSPSLDYYLQHKDPDLLKAVNNIKNFKLNYATPEMQQFLDNIKQDLSNAEQDIKIEENVDDPRRQQLHEIVNRTPTAYALDKTNQFILRSEQQAHERGLQTSDWTQDQIQQHLQAMEQQEIQQQKHPNQDMPDTVNMTQYDEEDMQDQILHQETVHSKGYSTATQDV
jgi:hypothetical protein